MAGTVHILNGQEMYNHFKGTPSFGQVELIPFNEAMCYGDTCSDIFSPEFIAIRSKVHQVTSARYSEITLYPLKPLFKGRYSRIEMWFDTDMFCQINLLTILAWLDQIKYQGDVVLQLVDDDFEPVQKYSLETDGYKALYQQVMINKVSPANVELNPLKKGVELYLNYMKQDSDLMLFIRGRQDMTENDLLALLLQTFKEYGLGDTQYAELIHRNRRFLG